MAARPHRENPCWRCAQDEQTPPGLSLITGRCGRCDRRSLRLRRHVQRYSLARRAARLKRANGPTPQGLRCCPAADRGFCRLRQRLRSATICRQPACDDTRAKEAACPPLSSPYCA
jgi:hypothetical protein